MLHHSGARAMKKPVNSPGILRHHNGRFTGGQRRLSLEVVRPVTEIRLKSHPHVTFSFLRIRKLLVMRGAFVVRLGQGTDPSTGHFEGSVEEVDSGKELKFQSSSELLGFLGECFQAVFEDTPEDNSTITPNDKAEPEARSVTLKSSRAVSRNRRQ